MVDLAVIIVSYNVRALLARTLVSLEGALRGSGLSTRTIVVDNQSSDDSVRMVRERFPSVELLALDRNLGFAGGNNVALRHLEFGEGRHGAANALWLLNPDTEVTGDAPAQLYHHLRENPGVGAVGPALRYGDGSFQHGAFAFPGLLQIAFDLFGAPGRVLESRLNGRYPARLWRGDRPFPVEMLLGAALMVRGETVAQVGLMDEGYFMYAEELDWCRRMHEAGWALHALPPALVVHHSGQSTQQFRERMFVALWRSRLRYYEKWESPLYVSMVRGLLRVGMAWKSFRLRRQAGEESRRRLAAYHDVATL